jgi:capsular polysaccharide transport system permease protein
MDDTSAGSVPEQQSPPASQHASSIRRARRQKALQQAAAVKAQLAAIEERRLERVRARETGRPDILPVEPADEFQEYRDETAAIIDASVITPIGKWRTLRRIVFALVALVLIVLPILAGIVYFGFYAADQYVSEARFAIRSQQPMAVDPSMASPLSGILGSPAPGLADAQIVVDYLQSEQLLQDIADDVDLKSLYSVDKADWWMRLNPDVSNEGLLDYWRWVSTVEIDPLSGIVTLTVRGFTPQDAKAVSEAALSESEKLVNRLSERAKADAIKSATEEVEAAYRRVIQSLNDIQKFQETERQINPTGLAQARSEIQSKLEGTLAEFEAQLTSLQKTMSERAPTVVWLKNQIAAVKAQIDAEKSKATKTTAGSTGQDVVAASKLLSQFDKLNLERTFAEKAYLGSLTTLESARMEANRQSRYLEAFVRPQLPQEPRYPNRPAMVLLVAGCSLGIWLLVMLIGATIREHM